MVSCNCDFLSTHRSKMVFLGGIGVGVTIILIGLLIGLTTIELEALGGDSFVSTCIRFDHGCILPENGEQNGTTGKQCCSPYVCRSQEATNQINQTKTPSMGKCLEANSKQPDISSTTERSTTLSNECPYSTKLEQILEPVRSGDEFDRTLEFYNSAKEGYLRLSAHRGDQRRNYLLSIRELNADARKYISITTENIGQNIFPLIVATDTGVGLDGIGGTFTIYFEDGSSQTVNPVSQEYEIRKGLSHIPLGIYGIIVPYFQLTHSSGTWRKELLAFGEKIKEALSITRLSSVVAGDGEIDLINDSLQMLEISSKYVSRWLDQSGSSNEHGAPKTVTVTEFEEYSKELFPFLDKSIRITAALQMRDVIPVLKKWKHELGHEKWKEVYAVIPTIYPVSAINPRFQAIAEVMTPEQAKNQIFILENGGSVEQLRKILGRIIAHRTAANLIFGTNTARAKEFTFSLSGRQDLMSIDAQDTLNAMHHS